MAVLWYQNGAIVMPVNLSIKNVPDALAAALKARAAANHRSLNGEVLELLKTHSTESPINNGLDIALARLRALNFSSPSESTQMIRDDRDSR
jgi:antitoxin FitA